MGRRKTSKKAVRKPKQGRSRATVEAILEATAQILVERGYAKTTTNHIAGRAGVSVASFYDYFENKDSAVTAVAARMAEKTRSHAMESARSLMHLPPLQMLRGWLGAMSDFALENAALLRTFVLEASFVWRAPQVRGAAMDLVREAQPYVFRQQSVPHEWLTEERLMLITVTAGSAILQITADPGMAEKREELLEELTRMITGYIAMTAMALQKRS
ncbi:MAG: TetR/AcrR family transcriptional regulator [Chrysiogenetes bacterium]|nr:TetR/AcrR family transcriptional regulator [Chrysiogenetes bacterium]